MGILRKNSHYLNRPMKNLTEGLLVLGICAAAMTASAQVLVNETFDYPDLASLQANWGNKTGLSLADALGNPAPSAAHDGSAQFHSWIGSPLSVVPTAASPMILKADIWSSGTAGQRNTVGFRTGASPLFEMGLYNAFDNDVDGPLSPSGTGIGMRILNFAGSADLTGQDWVLIGDMYEGWARWEATFTDLSLTVRVDEGIDGTWDITYTSVGTTPAAAFTDLRFGGPSGLASAAGGFNVDNISVTIVPEPSTAALLTLAALLLARQMRQRRA